MDRKDSVVPEEEEDEERPQLPNGIPGQWTDFNLCVFVNQNVNSCILKIPTHVDRDCGSLQKFFFFYLKCVSWDFGPVLF